MQLQLNVPNDAANGSKWMIFRRSGKLSFASVFEGALYAGDDTDFELDTEFNDNGDRDPVVRYSLIGEPKAASTVGSDLKCGVSIDHEALSAVLGKLDRVAEILKQIPEVNLPKNRLRDATNALSIIESIKSDILE